jgi:hypothetical protein
MRGIDDLDHAAGAARAQVRDARAALAASREARTGGRARDAREAERQLIALRDAVTTDARELRDRLTGTDPAASRTLGLAALATTGTLASVLGAGLIGRRSLARATERRRIERQASALGRVLAEQARAATQAPVGAAASPRRRRRGGGLLVVAALGAAVAGAVALQQRRSAPIDPDDLWLPEEDPGPA